MSENSTSDTDENILNEFVKYWDIWHREWYDKCAKVEVPEHIYICGWLIPRKKPIETPI